MNIKAIPTRYKGYHFRSRTEARWAVFFEALGLIWEYEPQGFDTPDGPYLPDFKLHGDYGPVWFEVKGVPPTSREVDLLRYVVRAVPPTHGELSRYPSALIAAGSGDSLCLYEVGLHWSDVDTYKLQWPDWTGGRYNGNWEMGLELHGITNATDSDGVRVLRGAHEAMDKFRAARFEHGEVPA